MTDVYQTTRNKEKTQAELATSIKALVDNDIDMLICEVWQIQAVLLNVQCLTIENRQSPFYVVNQVTLTGEKLYQKSC